MKINPSKYLTLPQAAEYLGIKAQSLSAAYTRGRIACDVRQHGRAYFKKRTLDKYRDGVKSLPVSPPEGYISTSELLSECHRRNKHGQRLPRSNAALVRLLRTFEVPSLHCCNPNNSPGKRLVWEQEKALDVLADERAQTSRSYREENHIVAPPEILRSPKWVTCARAADLIGCTALEISSRAAHYSFKTYLHPQSKKLLVNVLQVKEEMMWRKPSTIIRVLGAAGYALVKRTCPKKRHAPPMGGVVYRVPELLGAYLTPRSRALQSAHEAGPASA